MASTLKHCILCFLVLLSITWDSAELSQAKKINFIDKTTQQVVEFMGYQTETHDVDSDGYVIRLTRMINPLANQRKVKRTVLFLHGLLQDSIIDYLSFARYARAEKPTRDSYSVDIFSHQQQQEEVALGKNGTSSNLKRMCLPCLFSNNNYDVWIMNERGATRDSSQVSNWTLAREENYWNYNLDNSALVDLPNVIDYVIKKNNNKKITYVGVSKGTIVMFLLLAKHPEYRDKLAAFVALAPIAYGDNIRGILKLLPLFGPLVRNLNEPIVSYRLALALNSFLATICPMAIWNDICHRIANSVAGPDKHKDNIITDVAFSHLIEPQSMKTLSHLAQAMTTGKTSRFDYGARTNMKVYGQSEPPEYDMSKIDFDKIILVRSEGNDFLSVKEGQHRLINAIKVPIFRDIVVPPAYNHFGLIVNKNAFKDVFAPSIRAVNEAYLTK